MRRTTLSNTYKTGPPDRSRTWDSPPPTVLTKAIDLVSSLFHTYQVHSPTSIVFAPNHQVRHSEPDMLRFPWLTWSRSNMHTPSTILGAVVGLALFASASPTPVNDKASSPKLETRATWAGGVDVLEACRYQNGGTWIDIRVGNSPWDWR